MDRNICHIKLLFAQKTRLVIVLLIILVTGIRSVYSNEPDSAYILAYSSLENDARNGLHFAWSHDRMHWHSIGPEHSFLTCDYGSWSTEKRMYDPFLFQVENERWYCFWSVNKSDGVFALTSSEDLIHWKPQSYPVIIEDNNSLEISVRPGKDGKFHISFLSTGSGDSLCYQTTTQSFRDFSGVREIEKSERNTGRVLVHIAGEGRRGTIHKVAWKMVDQLIKHQQLTSYKSQLTNEYFPGDPAHLDKLGPVKATVHADLSDSKPISDMLMGIFFEDINYAADGGLYAELIQNRGFEYHPADRRYADASWNSTHSWSLSDSSHSSLIIDSVSPVHINNRHYAVLQARKKNVGLRNEGFAGIAVKNQEHYDFSVFAKSSDGENKTLTIRLLDKEDGEIARTEISCNSSAWEKLEAVLVPEQTYDEATLEILVQSRGQIALDMVSLFPRNTFKGRKNGLRDDLARTIEDMHPRFVRFPGGCVVHGDGLHNIYRWKHTIGPLEARKPQRNIWGYHQSYGLGFFEYFQFCEDIGAEPIPVIAAGVPCQNSSDGGAGQQGGLPMCEMDQYVKDILDLIEYCNGSPSSTWGKKRAEAGHPEPFNLKYIGIGNEDLITDIFKERFEIIFNAIKEEYPEIVVIGTVGPFNEGSDYDEGWDFADRLGLEMVDEHYYQQPGWFIHNQDFYDRYDRKKSGVYLGEYASWGNRLYNALSEAVYLTAIERNADIVRMASYAPLLAKKGFTQWGTDLIFFSNTGVFPTPSYEVQKLFGQHQGDEYIHSYVKFSDKSEAVRNKIGVSLVKDRETGDLIIKMVNLLPVEVNAEFILEGWQHLDSRVIQTLLSGEPDDKEVRPFTKAMDYNEKLSIVLPPYSFVVNRVMHPIPENQHDTGVDLQGDKLK